MARTIGNCRNTSSPSGNQIQRFAGALNEDGELPLTGTSLLSLTPSVIYTSQPNNVNCHLYVEVVSDTQATVKNTGEILNAGVSVKGKFE